MDSPSTPSQCSVSPTATLTSSADVTRSMARLRMTPFLPYEDDIRGLVYDVADGILREATGGQDTTASGTD